MQRLDHVEPRPVAEPQIDDGEIGRIAAHLRDPFRDRLGGANIEAARLHRPRQPGQERLVVIDQEKAQGRLLPGFDHGHPQGSF